MATKVRRPENMATAINLEAALALALPDLFAAPSSSSSHNNNDDTNYNHSSGVYALSESTDIDNNSSLVAIPKSPRGRRGGAPTASNRISFADDPTKRVPSPSDFRGGYISGGGSNTNKFGLSLDFEAENCRLENRRRRQQAVRQRRQQWAAEVYDQQLQQNDPSSTATSPRKTNTSPLPQSPAASTYTTIEAQWASMGRKGSLRARTQDGTGPTTPGASFRRDGSVVALPTRRRSNFPDSSTPAASGDIGAALVYTSRRSVLMSDDDEEDENDEIPMMESIGGERGQALVHLLGHHDDEDAHAVRTRIRTLGEEPFDGSEASEEGGQQHSGGDDDNNLDDEDFPLSKPAMFADREKQMEKILKGSGGHVAPAPTSSVAVPAPEARSALKKKSSFTTATPTLDDGEFDELGARSTSQLRNDVDSSSSTHPILTPLTLPASPSTAHKNNTTNKEEDALLSPTTATKRARISSSARGLPSETPHLTHVTPRTRAKLRTPATSTTMLPSPMPPYTLPPKASSQRRGGTGVIADRAAAGGGGGGGASSSLRRGTSVGSTTADLDRTDEFEEGFSTNPDDWNSSDEEDPELLTQSLKVCEGDEIKAKCIYRMELVRRSLQQKRLKSLGPFEDLYLYPDVVSQLDSCCSPDLVPASPVMDTNHSSGSSLRRSQTASQKRNLQRDRFTSVLSTAFAAAPKSIVVPRQPLCMTAAERQAEADALCNYFTAELLMAKGLAAPRPPAPEVVQLVEAPDAADRASPAYTAAPDHSPVNGVLDATVAVPLSPRTPLTNSSRQFVVNSFVPTSFLGGGGGGGGEYMGALGAIQGVAGNMAIQSGNSTFGNGNIGNTMKSFVPVNALGGGDISSGVYNPFASLFGGGFGGGDGSPPALQRSPFSDPSSPGGSPVRSRPREITIHMAAVLQDLPLPPALGMYLHYIESETKRLFKVAAEVRAGEMCAEADKYHSELLLRKQSMLSNGSSSDDPNVQPTEGRGSLGNTLRRFFGSNKQDGLVDDVSSVSGGAPSSPTAAAGNRLSSQSLPRVLSDLPLQRGLNMGGDSSPPTSPLYNMRLPSSGHMRRGGGAATKPLPPFVLKIRITDKSAVKGIDVVEGTLRQLFYGAEAVSGTTKGTQGSQGGGAGGGTFGARGGGGGSARVAGHMPTPKTTALSSDWLVPKGPPQLKELVDEHVVLINHAPLATTTTSTSATAAGTSLTSPTGGQQSPTFGGNLTPAASSSFAVSPPDYDSISAQAPISFTNWTPEDIVAMHAKFQEAADAFIEDRHRDVLQAYYRAALSDRPNHYRLYLSDDITWEEESLVHLEAPCMPAFTALLMKPTARALRFLMPRFSHVFFGSALPVSTLQCGLGSNFVVGRKSKEPLRITAGPSLQVTPASPPKRVSTPTTATFPPTIPFAAAPPSTNPSNSNNTTTTPDLFILGHNDDELLIASSLSGTGSFDTTSTQVVRFSPIFLAVAARLFDYHRCESAVEEEIIRPDRKGASTSTATPATSTMPSNNNNINNNNNANYPLSGNSSQPSYSADGPRGNNVSSTQQQASTGMASLASVTHRYLPVDCTPFARASTWASSSTSMIAAGSSAMEAYVCHDQYLSLYKHLTHRSEASEILHSLDGNALGDGGVGTSSGGAGGGGGGGAPNAPDNGSTLGASPSFGSMSLRRGSRANGVIGGVTSTNGNNHLSTAPGVNNTAIQSGGIGELFTNNFKGRGRSGALHSYNYSASGVVCAGEGSSLVVDASQGNSTNGSSYLHVPKGTWWDRMMNDAPKNVPWSNNSSSSAISINSSAAAQIASHYGLSHEHFVALVKVTLAASTAAVELSASDQYQDFVAARRNASQQNANGSGGGGGGAPPLGGSSLFAPPVNGSRDTVRPPHPNTRLGGLGSANSSSYLTGSSGGSSSVGGVFNSRGGRPNTIGALFFTSLQGGGSGNGGDGTSGLEESGYSMMVEGGVHSKVWGHGQLFIPRSPLVSSPSSLNGIVSGGGASIKRTTSTGSNSRIALRQIMPRGLEQMPLPLTVQICPTHPSAQSAMPLGNTGPSSFANLLLKQHTSTATVTEVALDPFQLLQTFFSAFFPQGSDNQQQQGTSGGGDINGVATNMVTSIPALFSNGSPSSPNMARNDTNTAFGDGSGVVLTDEDEDLEENFALTFKPRRLRTLNEDEGTSQHHHPTSITPTLTTPPQFPLGHNYHSFSPNATMIVDNDTSPCMFKPSMVASAANDISPAAMALLSNPAAIFQRQFEGLLVAAAAVSYVPTTQFNRPQQSGSDGFNGSNTTLLNTPTAPNDPSAPSVYANSTTNNFPAAATRNPVLSHHLRTVSSSVHDLLSADAATTATPTIHTNVGANYTLSNCGDVVRTTSDSVMDGPIAAAVASKSTREDGSVLPLKTLMKEYLAAPHQLTDAYNGSPLGSRRSSTADLYSRVGGVTGNVSRTTSLNLPRIRTSPLSSDPTPTHDVIQSPSDNASYYRGPLGPKRMSQAEQRRLQEMREVELNVFNGALRDFLMLFQANDVSANGGSMFAGVPRPTVTTVVSMVAPSLKVPSTVTGPSATTQGYNSTMASNTIASRVEGGGVRLLGMPTPLNEGCSGDSSSPAHRQPSPPPLLPSPTEHDPTFSSASPARYHITNATNAVVPKEVEEDAILRSTLTNNPMWFNPVISAPQVFRTGPVDDVLITVEVRVRLPSAKAAEFHKNGYASLITNNRNRMMMASKSIDISSEVNNASMSSFSANNSADKNLAVVSIKRSVVVPSEMTVDALEDHIMKEIGIDVEVSKVPNMDLTAEEEHILRRHHNTQRGSLNIDDAEFSSDDDMTDLEIAKQAQEITRRKKATLPYLLFVKYGPLLEMTIDERFDFIGPGGGVAQAPYMFAPVPIPPNPLRGNNINLDASITSMSSFHDSSPTFGFYNPNLHPLAAPSRASTLMNRSESATPNASFASRGARGRGASALRFGVGSSAVVSAEDLQKKVEEQQRNNEQASIHYQLTDLHNTHQQHLASGCGAGTDGVDVLDGYTRGREGHIPALRDHTTLSLSRHGVDTFVLDLSTVPADALRVRVALPPMHPTGGPNSVTPSASPAFSSSAPGNSSLTGDRGSAVLGVESKFRLGHHKSSGNALVDMDEGPMSMLPFSSASLRSNARSGKSTNHLGSSASSAASSALPPGYTPHSTLELWMIDQCRFTALTVNPKLNTSVAYGNEHLPYQRDEEGEDDEGGGDSDQESDSNANAADAETPTRARKSAGGTASSSPAAGPISSSHITKTRSLTKFPLDPTATSEDDLYYSWFSAQVLSSVLLGRGLSRFGGTGVNEVSKYDRRLVSLHYQLQHHQVLATSVLREILYRSGDTQVDNAAAKVGGSTTAAVSIPIKAAHQHHQPSGLGSKEWRVSMGSYASQLAERYNTGNKYSSSLSAGLNTSLLTSCYASAPVRSGRDAASQSINYTATRPLNDFITSHFYKGGGVGAVGKLGEGDGSGGLSNNGGSGGADQYSLLYSRLDEDEARAYQHFDVIKINKYGTPQRRVIGVDGERIYNMRPSTEVGKTKNPERNVSDIKTIRTFPERPLYFEIEYLKEVKVDTDCIECRSVADCLLMVEKLKVLKRMIDLKAGGRAIASARRPGGGAGGGASGGGVASPGSSSAITPRGGGTFKKVLFKLGIGTKD